MRIAIIGAGIIGVTSAYELSADGHAVTVLERCSSVAAETSFANAGLVAPGYVTPWAAPGMPGKVLRGLFSRHSPVRFGGLPDWATLQWGWRWWRACRAPVHQANRLRMQRLAYFSRDRLRDLRARLELDYERSEGYLVLLRSARELALARPGLATLAALGTRHEILDAAGCRAVEPGLNPATALHAGIYLPDDEVGNCRQFAHLLRREAEHLGARFRFDTMVQRIVPGARPRLQLADVEETYDRVLVCAAVDSVALLRPLGVRVPLQAVHGPNDTIRARLRPCTRCCTTGFPESHRSTRRNAGKGRGRCCPTVRRCWARAAPKASGSISGTARAAGRWPAARHGCSPTDWKAALRPSTPTASASSDCAPEIGRPVHLRKPLRRIQPAAARPLRAGAAFAAARQ